MNKTIKRLSIALLGLAITCSINGNVSAKDTIKPKATEVYTNVSFKSCHDGDTCTFETETGNTLKVRLWGIDAPEIGQPFGQAAKDAASYWLREFNDSKFPHTIALACYEKKSYGRNVCIIVLYANSASLQAFLQPARNTELLASLAAANQSELVLNGFFVLEGYAWDSSKYSGGKHRYLQELAQKNKIGIWGLPGEKIAPWEWRKSR